MNANGMGDRGRLVWRGEWVLEISHFVVKSMRSRSSTCLDAG